MTEQELTAIVQALTGKLSQATLDNTILTVRLEAADAKIAELEAAAAEAKPKGKAA